MPVLKPARITMKARKALQTLADLYQIRYEDMRKDRAAVHQVYAELEATGYEWIASKQEWAMIAPVSAPVQTMTFKTSVFGDELEDAAYILQEGFIAAGYTVLRMTCESVTVQGMTYGLIETQVQL